MKNRISSNSDKVHTNFGGWNMPRDNVECEHFTIISIDSLLVWENKYCLQIYLDKCVYKKSSKQITDHLDENLFSD